VVTLSLTGDLPSIGDDGPARGAGSRVTIGGSAGVAEQRQLSRERNDDAAWQRSVVSTELDTARVTGDKYDYLLRDLSVRPGDDTRAASPTDDGAVSGLIDPNVLRHATQEPQVVPNYRLIALNVLPGDDARAARAAQLETMRRYYEHKEARLEAAELQAAVLAARAARQEQLRRFYEHKEQMLDGMGQGEAAGRPSNDIDPRIFFPTFRPTDRAAD
jgi:hypothetical protein